jgi:hypothetical protein
MKKSIPLAIRKLIDELASNQKNLLTRIFDDNSVIKFLDNDPQSVFYFELQEIITDNSGKTSYRINYLPTNEENLRNT